MAWYNRVKESGRIVASGNIELLGAYPGYTTFKSVFGVISIFGISPNQSGFPARAYYTFESGSTWEVGYGFISGSPGGGASDILIRDIIYSSSQTNSKVNATSGLYVVFHNPPAKHLDDLDLGFYMGMGG